ncbi:MAG: symmetrical bis(5'-nucleosyl)-tetraphosphatase [Thermoanaerobaculia bacterium]
MATYAIGDVHGCFRTLELLLLRLPFESGSDRLWLTGDLVNRGPRSLEVLRWAEGVSRDLGKRFVSVLGNHDLHLLATAAGHGRPHHRGAFADLLEASDADRLVDWLARRPLFHRDGATVLVHAGLFPEWSLAEAAGRAAEFEAVLREESSRVALFASVASDGGRLPRNLYGLTSLRMLKEDGEVCDFTGPPELAPEGCIPWFEVPGRRSRDVTVVAGHWAALGLRREDDFVGLDTGCVYGGSLTAVRLEDREVFSVPNRE